jgi:hypothetical protein
MFCKRLHYKNPTCFGHYSMTIFRGRPSFLVHLLPFSCLFLHISVNKYGGFSNANIALQRAYGHKPKKDK